MRPTPDLTNVALGVPPLGGVEVVHPHATSIPVTAPSTPDVFRTRASNRFTPPCTRHSTSAPLSRHAPPSTRTKNVYR
jgi:hypothetical protein